MAALNPGLADLSDDDRQVLDSWLIEFDQRWDEGLLANRLDQIPPGSSWRLPALAEMVKVDLQRQWQRGRQVSLESYLEEFPELGSPGDVSADLIQAEYEVRRQFGAPVALDDYLRRFPQQAEELGRLIAPNSSGPARHASVAAPPRSFSRVQRSEETPEQLPEQFGRYRIIKRLGQGGMGSVYLAQDTHLERPVALKIPDFDKHEGPDARRRFLEEARTAATLDHPYLCPVYDAGEIDGQPYLTMAYIEGQSLAALIGDEGWPQRQVAALVGKLALALQEAHTQKVTHRDLKPANVMIKTTRQRREPVIVDFGLARRDSPQNQRLTRSGQVVGTLGYMAPEQVRGDLNEIGPACDIYALGVILYEMLTGRLPFSGSGIAVAGQILTQTPLPPSAHRTDLDPALEAICLKGMAKAIGDRYTSMAELAAALTGFLQSSPASPAPAVSSGSPASPSPASGKHPQPAGSNSLVGEFLAQLAGIKESPSAIPTPEPVTLQAPLPERRRRPWPLIVAAGVLSVTVLLVIIIYVVTDKGRIKVVVEGPLAAVQVDGEQIPIETPRESISLRAGEHELTVNWRDGQFRTDRFVVRRGQDRALRVAYEPTASGRESTTRQASPSSGTGTSDAAENPPEAPADKRTARLPALKAETVVPRSKGDNATAWSRLMAREGSHPIGPPPYACWTFESDARDDIGSLHGRTLGGAVVREGRLYLDSRMAHMRTEPLSQDVREKTLEAWVLLRNLDQRGGGVISIEHGGTFDAIVFGELQPKKWIAGSDFFNRTVNLGAPVESARPTDVIHMSIVYDLEGGITVYRNGGRLGERYLPKGDQLTQGFSHPRGARAALRTYPAGDTVILLGQRLTGAACLAGEIEEARLYDRALTADEVAASYRAGVIHYTTENGVKKVPETVPVAAGRVEGKLARPLPTSAAESPARTPPDKPRVPLAAHSRLRAHQTAPPKKITNIIGMRLVLIPPGTFVMGSPDVDDRAEIDEKPQLRARISKPFYLGVHEVTQGQYRAVMGVNPSHFKGSDDLPAEQVSWLAAVRFCIKLSQLENLTPFYRVDGTAVTIVGGEGYRLPTEAEWEYACRAGSTTRYPFGDDAGILGEYAWYRRNSEGKSHPVGQKLPNAWGIHDMLGNVLEWCGDWYGERYYASSPGLDPSGPPSASNRVDRGGSWTSILRYCRSADRAGFAPGTRNNYLGFRLALVASGR
jgi:formylglycine-generating enzyme required for sulfatase activity/serine/threonine protein kinase